MGDCIVTGGLKEPAELKKAPVSGGFQNLRPLGRLAHMQNRFNVQVTWDAEAEMWVADSDDIPGLAAEAPDDKSLWEKLEVLIPELLALNEVRLKPNQDIEVMLNFQPRKERIQPSKAA